MQNTNNYNDWYLLDIYYYSTTDPQESFNALTALSFVRSTWLLDGYYIVAILILKILLNNRNNIYRLLQELLAEETYIKPQDFFETISLTGDNPIGRNQAWVFVRRYFDEIIS